MMKAYFVYVESEQRSRKAKGPQSTDVDAVGFVRKTKGAIQ